jgi:DNA-binding transcriptional MocR family regulator
MTEWRPDLSKYGKPHYLAIVQAIMDDVAAGRLGPAERLPPQRQLAERLSLNFSTVARGYVEAQRRGLIESRVGQGTFVSLMRPAPSPPGPRRPALVDFTMNLPPEPEDPDLLGRMRQGFAAVSADLPGLLRFQGFGGSNADKAAALAWLGRRGLEAEASRLLICPGAHSALLAIMSTIAKPGEAICSEDLTYPGARSISAHLGLRLIGLPMDEEGIDAAAFAATCVKQAPKALYLNPTLLNPTTMTISARRREAIVEVAQRYNVIIIEDDAYGFVPPHTPPPFYAIAPQLTYHVAGLAKCLGAGLRIAYVLTPSARAALPLAANLRAATVMASPVTAALATTWIEDGTADLLLAFIRAESAARQRLAAEVLPQDLCRADPHGFHIWMHLPESWSRSAFASQARATGIGVVAADPFVAAGPVPEAVRICLGGLANRQEVAHALDVIAHALADHPTMASAFI